MSMMELTWFQGPTAAVSNQTTMSGPSHMDAPFQSQDLAQAPSKRSSDCALAEATSELKASQQLEETYRKRSPPGRFSATAPAATRPMVSLADARPPPLEALAPYFTWRSSPFQSLLWSLVAW